MHRKSPRSYKCTHLRTRTNRETERLKETKTFCVSSSENVFLVLSLKEGLQKHQEAESCAVAVFTFGGAA